jgi:hypothetical protein
MLGRVKGAGDSSQEKSSEFGHGVCVVVVLMVGMRSYIGEVDRDGVRCDMRGRMLNALIADYESIGVGAVILQVSDR